MRLAAVGLAAGACAWAPAMAAAPAGTPAAKSETQYLAAFVGGRKLGYGKHVRQERDGKVVTSEEMVISAARAGITLTIRMVETSTETPDGKPLGFAAVQDLGLMQQTVEGRIADGKLHVTITQAGREQKRTEDWPAGALLAEGQRLAAIARGLKEGTRYTLKVYSPALLRAIDANVVVGPVRQTDLLGRVVPLTEVKTTLIGRSNTIESLSYVDRDLNALKSVTPAMGMTIELVACSREVATAPGEPVDFFDRLLVASPAALPGADGAREIVYRISPTDPNAEPKFLETPSQKVVYGKGGRATVTVAPAAPAAGAPLPYRGDAAEAKAALRPTRFLQSDDPKVKALAREATAGAKDAAGAAKAVQDFVARYVQTKSLSVGYATAAEVAASRQGDCSEHAVLAAAMCRAAGVPAQVVTGLAYVPRFAGRQDVFVPHAWFRAWIGGRWIDYDAALKRFDARHIALTAGDGEPEEFFGIAGTLGLFRIDSAKVVR